MMGEGGGGVGLTNRVLNETGKLRKISLKMENEMLICEHFSEHIEYAFGIFQQRKSWKNWVLNEKRFLQREHFPNQIRLNP